MWAHVRVVHLKPPNDQQIIQVKNIKNFDQKRIKNKLFNFYVDDSKKTTQVCQVISYANSKSDIENALKKKRPIIPPKKNLDSASETTDHEIQDRQANISKVNENEFVRKNLQNRLQHLIHKKQDFDNHNSVIDDHISNDTAEINSTASKASDKECQEILNLKKEIIELQKEIDDKNERLNKYEKDVQSFVDANRKLKEDLEEINYLDGKLREKDETIAELQSLNQRWQNSGLNRWEEMKAILENCAEKNPGKGLKGRFLPSGHLSDDGSEIHLGRDVWLPVRTYAFITCNVKSVSVLARNFASALFDEATLRQSTITGRKSNRNSAKTSDETVKSVLQLDPIKVMAIKDFIRYYIMEEWHMPEERADAEADLVRAHIAKKIAEIKAERGQQKKKKRKNNADKENTPPAEPANQSSLGACSEAEEIFDIDPFQNNVSVQSVEDIGGIEQT